MASSMASSSSFLTRGAPMMHGSCECHNRQHRSYGAPQSRVLITCESSTAYNNRDSSSSSQKQQQHVITELKSSVAENMAPGLHKILESSSPRRNWWTPIFNFSSEGMWSTIQPKQEEEAAEHDTSGRIPVAVAAAATEATIFGIPSATEVRTPQGGSSSSSISLPELIASSSSKQMPSAVAAAIAVSLIQHQQLREGTTLSDLIASSSSQRNPRGVRERSSSRKMKQVVFDEKKARELRKQTRLLQTWHDAWVHSAIASRLAVPEE
ncbi:hypothetical protein R1flu_011212 [Riccia fluitans]|uniref:Uncharacterized protein n=1 Tax=Riccia fluitans TaxID=41844 RepID=A0ABD1Z7Y1_9MARC